MPYFRVVREVEFLVQADGREEADRLAENAVTYSDIQPQLDLRARLGGDFEVVDHWRVGPVLEITNEFGTSNIEDHPADCMCDARAGRWMQKHPE